MNMLNNKNKEECDVSKDKGNDEMYRVENEFFGVNISLSIIFENIPYL